MLKKLGLNLNVLVVLGLLVGLLLPLIVAPTPVSAQSWLSNYTYRQKFSLSRPDGAVSNYTIFTEVNKGAGTSLNQTIYLDSHAENWTASVPNDIRFTRSDGTTLLDYGILWSNTTYAKVAVEFNSIGTNPTNFYCYYGKSDAADGTDLSNVGLYGDDFNRPNSDTVGEGWTNTTAWYGDIVSNQVQNYFDTGGGTLESLWHDYTFDSNVTVYLYTKAPAMIGNLDGYHLAIADENPLDGAGLWGIQFQWTTGPIYKIRVLKTGGWADISTYTPGDWYEFEMVYRDSDGQVKVYVDGILENDWTLGHQTVGWTGWDHRIVFAGDPTPQVNWYSDSLLVRPWVDPEPQWEVWYTEESSGVSTTTSNAGAVGTTTATLNANLTSMGEETSVYCYFQYGTTTSYGTNTTEQTKYATGSFVQGLTTLQPSTQYHFRAAVRYDTSSYVYGSDNTFYTDAEGDWYGAYQHVQSFNLTKTTTRTNYPVELTINKGTGTSTGTTIYLQNNALSWTGTVPNDIRFTNDDQQLMPYWIKTSTTTQATIFMSADSISSTPGTFHIYYGLADDTTASDIAETFTFGDDFEDYSIGDLSDQSSWSDILGGDIAEEVQVEVVDSRNMIELEATEGYMRIKQAVDFGSGASGGRSVVAYVYAENPTEHIGISMCDGTTTDANFGYMDGYSSIFYTFQNTYHTLMEGNGSSSTEHDKTAGSTTTGVYHEIEMRWYDNTLKGIVDGTEVTSGSDATYASKSYLVLGHGSGGAANNWNVDWIYVRQFDGETVTVDSWVGEGGTTTPTVTTGTTSGVSTSGATLWGSIVSTGNSTVTQRGFDYGKVYEDFTFVVFPDTQEWTQWGTTEFEDAAQWVVDNADALNIKFVIHVGDIINVATNAYEWVIADEALEIIEDAGIPLLVVPGNKDYNYADWHDMSDRDLTTYDTYFPASRFNTNGWFGGSYPSGTMHNSYGYFSASGEEFIVIGYELYPTDTTLAWVESILDANLDKHVIIFTHGYLENDGTRGTYTDVYGPEWYNLDDGNSGDQIWNELLSNYPNIVMVDCGHIPAGGPPSGGANRRVDYVDGEPVHQILQCYQSYPESGDGANEGGWLRHYTFSLDSNEIYAYTYSPFLDQSYTTDAHQFIIDFRSSGSSYETYPYSTTETGTFSYGTFSLPIYNLEANQYYRYRAKALNTEGWGYGTSKTFQATGTAPTVPGAPTGFSASPTATLINLSWNKGTGASTTLIRYSTDTYPATTSSGQQLYSGTGTSYIFTTAELGITYYFSAWSEAGGMYSVTYAYVSGKLGTPGELPYPGGFNIDSVKVFRNYWAEGDVLIVLSYKELFAETPAEDIKECMFIQVLDGTILKAQGVPTQWGFRPASIWLAPGNDLTWGAAYEIVLEGRDEFWETTPVTSFVLTAGSWMTDLDYLKTWVLDTADRMEDYYTDLGIDLVAYGTVGRVLTPTGGDWFSSAIPYLRILYPELFSTGVEGLEGYEKGEIGYEGAENMTVAWGEEIAGHFQSLGESMGLSGESAGGIIWIVFTFIVAGIVGVAVGPSLGMVICLPLVGTGVYLTLLDMTTVIAIGIAIFVLAMFVYFIKGSSA